jgi:gliding motility-associated-like protein
MKSISQHLILLLCLVVSCMQAQYIQTFSSYTAQQLVEDVLVNSPCATVSNFSVTSNTDGAPGYAYFTNNSPAFPFADGVLLSTAPAYLSAGPNNSLIDTGSTDWPGDNDIEQALQIGPTFNATVLEFDFIPLANKISFRYVFQSEEYLGSAPCQYSDGFAFLLRQVVSQDQYENLAVIPGTTTPVKVTTVRPQITSGNGCPAMNEQYFGGYNPVDYPTNYAAGTVALKAEANVIPNQLYHIKLVIADDKNVRYDSGIFLEAGSFVIGTDIGPDRLIATHNAVCDGNQVTLSVNEPGTHSYQWYKDGVPLAATGSSYTVNSAGTYSVEVDLNNSGCIITGEAIIEYVPAPPVTPATLLGCDPNGDGQATFDLTALKSMVITGNPDDYTVTYFANSLDAQLNQNPITNLTQYTSGSTTLFLRVSNTFGCTLIVSAQLTPTAPVSLPAVSKSFCGDGSISVSLSTEISPQILASLPAGTTVQYFATSTDAESLLNPLPDIYAFSANSTLYATVQSANTCYQTIVVSLIHLSFGDGFQDQQITLCAGASASLQAPPGHASYLWNDESTTSSISVSQSGTYTVTVTNTQGCSTTQTFYVMHAEPAVFIGTDIRDLSNGPASVAINYSGVGAYEFSLDGVSFQLSPVFNDVAPGIYSVFIKESTGCGMIGPFEIVVLGYPRFFTPNGDGVNDLWNIPNIFLYPSAKVNIFDRYGKLLHQFGATDPGWDGTCNGHPLPSTDYWFTLDLGNGRGVKSHFSLKR